MKFVVYGVGAVGGVIAAKLALSGAEVVGIARGAQLDALRKTGLRLRTPESDELVRFGAAGGTNGLTAATVMLCGSRLRAYCAPSRLRHSAMA